MRSRSTTGHCSTGTSKGATRSLTPVRLNPGSVVTTVAGAPRGFESVRLCAQVKGRYMLRVERRRLQSVREDDCLQCRGGILAWAAAGTIRASCMAVGFGVVALRRVARMKQLQEHATPKGTHYALQACPLPHSHREDRMSARIGAAGRGE